jgi:hypothetical protein
MEVGDRRARGRHSFHDSLVRARVQTATRMHRGRLDRVSRLAGVRPELQLRRPAHGIGRRRRHPERRFEACRTAAPVQVGGDSRGTRARLRLDTDANSLLVPDPSLIPATSPTTGTHGLPIRSTRTVSEEPISERARNTDSEPSNCTLPAAIRKDKWYPSAAVGFDLTRNFGIDAALFGTQTCSRHVPTWGWPFPFASTRGE